MEHPIRLRGLAEFVACTPFLVGFAPERSVVAIGLTAGEVGLIARVGIPPRRYVAPASLVIAEPMAREGHDTALVISYETRPGESRHVVRALITDLAARGCEVPHSIVVRGGLWWCEGRPCECDRLPYSVPEVADSPAAADFVLSGRCVLPSRDSLLHAITPVPGSDGLHEAVNDAVVRLLEAPGASVRSVATRSLSAWGRLLSAATEHGHAGQPGAHVHEPDLPALLVTLLDRTYRDLLMGWLCPPSMPLHFFTPAEQRLARRVLPVLAWHEEYICPSPDDFAQIEHDTVHAVQDLLRQVVRGAPTTLRPAALTVLAHFDWWAGSGADAHVAVDEALRLDPDYRLAQLLSAMVSGGLRPDRREIPSGRWMAPGRAS